MLFLKIKYNYSRMIELEKNKSYISLEVKKIINMSIVNPEIENTLRLQKYTNFV